MPPTSPAWNDAPAGAKTHFPLHITWRADGSSIELPVIVARGRQSGKALLVTAGVHGDEFEGMAALRRVFGELDPAAMSGALVAVPIANPPSFEAGMRVNPDDRQDLARIFPGDATGTVSEQIAHALTHRFIRHADLYCDLHSAGQYYAMPPLAGYQLRDEPMLSQQRSAATAFGLELVWGTPGLPGRTLSVAGDYEVPSIYVETTGEGRCRAADVERYAYGLRQLLKLLAIVPGEVDRREPKWFVEDDRSGAGFLQMQNRAPCGGLFHAEVAVWDEVETGQRLGAIYDAYGNERHLVTAPHPGRIVFLRTFNRVLAGDALCNVLQLRR
jgi:predicted deacylase